MPDKDFVVFCPEQKKEITRAEQFVVLCRHYTSLTYKTMAWYNTLEECRAYITAYIGDNINRDAWKIKDSQGRVY